MKNIILFIFLLFFSCSNKNKQFFKDSLNDYIKNHPPSLLYQIDSVGKRKLINCVHPHYKIEFLENSMGERLLQISQKMYYTENKYGLEKKPIGIFFFKDLPIIVFDEFGFGDEFLFSQLNLKIPDSLKYDFIKCDGQMLHNKRNNPKIYRIK